MSSGEATQIAVAVVLTLTLAAVLWYASEARKQAKANAEMAREMRAQRLSSSRPIVLLSPLAEERGQERIRLALEGPLPDSAPVTLANVGPGIAVGVHVPYKLGGADSNERIIDYLPAGSSETEPYFYLRPVREADHRRVLRISYCDVFR